MHERLDEDCNSRKDDAMTGQEKDICPVCEMPLKDCVCCGCGHACPRELGEAYCPICLPEPGK